MAAERTTGRRHFQVSDRRSGYVQGSAVRKEDIRRQLEAPKKQLSHTTRKNRERARHMNFAYVLFLTAAMVVTGFALIGYIQMESSITTSVKAVSAKEKRVKCFEDGKRRGAQPHRDVHRSRGDPQDRHYRTGNDLCRRRTDHRDSSEGSDYVRQYADIEQ